MEIFAAILLNTTVTGVEGRIATIRSNFYGAEEKKNILKKICFQLETNPKLLKWPTKATKWDSGGF